MHDIGRRVADLIIAGADWLTVRSGVEQLLSKLGTSPSMASCAWHPYGFLIVKPWFSPHGAVRLHIWPEEERSRQVPDWPIHSHAWALRSYILIGCAINEIYAVTPDSKNATNRLYTVAYEGDESILTATETGVSCTLSSATTYMPREAYEVSQAEYHATHVPEHTFTATVVATWNPRDCPAHVVGEYHHAAQYRFRRQACQRQRAAALVEAFAQRLGSRN